MDRKMSLFATILALTCLFKYVSLESVPVLLWSNQVASVDAEARYSTLVDQIEPSDLLGDYLKRKVPIVAFVQKDLNVEQFAANDAPFVSSIFDNSQFNPVFFANVNTPRKVFSLFKNDGSIENENVAIYLSGKNLKENDDLIRSNAEKYNSSGPVVFMLTGEDNEFLKESKRSRRQAPTSAPKDAATVQHYPEDLNQACVLVSVLSASATFTSDKDVSTDPIRFINPTIDGANTHCNGNKAGKLALKFTQDAPTSPETLTVSWIFDTENGTIWKINSVEVATSNHGNLKSKNFHVSAPEIFSFSCQKSIVKLSGGSIKEYPTGSVTFEALQIQPFFNTAHTYIRFENSSDCAVWFTLPIWSGLIVSLILITILYFGIIALMSISTPDRFENPKGRALIISNFDE